MGLSTSAIDNSLTDPGINAILAESAEAGHPTRATCRYSQNEDQFTILDQPFTVPSFPVHHEFQNPVPPPGYIESLAEVVQSIFRLEPRLIEGTKWFFDAANIHAPGFYRIERFGDRSYLYLARIDLTCRPLESEILDRGSNSYTHRFRTNRLYHESDWFPLAPDYEPGLQEPIAFDQTIPVTWKGESGEGYMVHGIWMDADINKFLSKLVLPPGKRNHPFYPVTCKHRCVSINALGLEPASNDRGPRVLHEIRERVEPELTAILEDLQSTSFSELLPLFREIKERFPAELGSNWKNLTVTPYLNAKEQKEYTIEF